ncbi:MAG TPA: PAS domain S-box protein, partial [Thermodesulfobacteriota bacterium]|nr:PAS domain S-box protein [Thermodesulfobacteriota bacterium]
MAKKQNSALSELHRGKHTSTRSPERKILNTRLVNRGRIRSFENLAITKSFPSRQTDEPLREAEHFLSDIFASIQDGISILDKDMNIIRVNQTMERWYSHAMPLVGKKCYEAYHGRSERCNICPTHQTVLTGKAAHEVVPKVGPGGKIVGWLDLYSFPFIETSTKKMRGVIEYVRDITERKRAEEQLLNAAQQWRTTFDGISDVVCLLDGQGRILKCNKAMTDLLGKPFSEIINRTHLEILHGAPMPTEECPVERLWKTHSRETDILLINGRWFSIAVDPLLDEVGRLAGAVHIMSDVTEQKRAEEAIRESEKRYRQVIQNAVDIVYTTDANGNFTYANPAALKTTGYSLEELQRLNYLDLILPEHRDRVSKILVSQFRERQATTYVEFPFFNKSGDLLWFGQNASLVIEREKRVGFHVIARDITERKRTEQALLESEERYKALYDRSLDCVYVLDFEGKFIDANQAALALLGYDRMEISSLNIASVLDERDLSKALQDMNDMIQVGFQEKITEYRLRRKDGGIVYVENQGSIIYRDGKPHSVQGIARDVTERRKIEEALRESENKFRNLVENSIVGVYLVQDGLFKYVNPRGAEIHGYKPEEIVDRLGPKQLALPEDWPTVEESIGKKIRGEEEFTHYEFRIVTKSQEIRNVEIFSSRTIYQVRPAVLATMLDVTERKRAEEVLRQSEERYRRILESIQEGYSEIDLRGNFTFVNNMTCKHLGYTKEELIGMDYRHYTSEENAKRIKKFYTEVYKTGEPIDITDHELISKDGTTATYEISISLIKNSEGKPIGFRSISRDVTQQRKSEKTLRQSEERYRTIIESIEDGYYEEDLAGNFTFFNDAMCRIYGYPKEELLGLNYKRYTDKETAKKLFQIFNEMYRTGNP